MENLFGRNNNVNGVKELQDQYNMNQRRMLTEKVSDEMFDALEDENEDLMIAINRLRIVVAK